MELHMNQPDHRTAGDPSKRSDQPAGLGRYAKDWMNNEQAARYVISRRPDRYKHYDVEQTLVRRWLGLCKPGAIVLDFPCGTGRFNSLTAECGHRLIRADRSPAMLLQARALGPNDHTLGNLCCDLARPPFPDKSVDIMILWRIFHHLRSWEDRRTVLEQAVRVARQYIIMSFYDSACLTYCTQMISQKCFRTRPKLGGAIRSSDLLDLTGSLGLTTIEIHHYRRFISLNAAACFRTSPAI